MLLQSLIISVSQQHVVRVLRTHWQNLRMLCQSMFIIAMRISIFQSLLFENKAYNIFTTFMRKRTAISLRFKNEAFIISKCYCNQLFFSVSQHHVVRVSTTHWQNLRMLCQSMFIIAMRISIFQSLLALLFENEA